MKARAEPTAAAIEDLPSELLEQILLESVQKDDGQVSATVKIGKYPMFDLHVVIARAVSIRCCGSTLVLLSVVVL